MQEKTELRCGLEIHQQLDTGKLFCRCPCKMHEEKPDFLVERKLRPVASELGEFDRTAIEQFERGYSYVYEAYKDTNCLIEIDEEPVMPANKEALKTALQAALMSKASIVDTAFVMRKQVVDGSDPSGFQRTMLIATGGSIQVRGKELGLQTIVLEEDAGRAMKKDEEAKKIYYRLDRLGIPLIEIATKPDITSPEEAKEAALAIGNLLRRTCRAKRGLGSIRQDVNISIKGGARVEIKGCQELELIDEYVRREMQRQNAIIEAREELQRRGVQEKDLQEKPVDASRFFGNSNCRLLKEKKVFAVKLKGFKGIPGKEVQPGRRIGTEIANYVKSFSGLKGILHSDEELEKIGISVQEIEALQKELAIQEKDAFVIAAHENRELALKGINAAAKRAKQILEGVSEETRTALPEGNTEYSRQLPGASRMYPETDLKPVKIEKKYLESLKKSLPKTEKERIGLYITKFGLSTQLAEKMSLDNYACFFEELAAKGYNTKAAAVLLLEGITFLKRDGFPVEEISEQMIEELLSFLKEKKISQEVLVSVLGEWSKKKHKSLESVVAGLKLEGIGEQELEKAVSRIVEKNSKLVMEKQLNAIGALMGEAMQQLRGKADGKTISELLRKKIGEFLKQQGKP